MKDLSSRVAFVSGGASGIGLSIARALAREGVRVAIGDIDAARTEAAVAELRHSGARACGVALDVAEAGSWAEAVMATERLLGPVDILCNNAGVGAGRAETLDVPARDWDWVLRINLGGVFLGTQAFGPGMRARRSGHIVNTASILGLFPKAGHSAYVASKFAVVGLSEAMRIELALHGVGVSVLCPGFVETPLRETSRTRRPSGEGVEDPTPPRPSALAAAAVGPFVVEAIRADRLYVFTHGEYRGAVEDRMGRLLSGFGAGADPAYREDVSALAGDSLALSAALHT